MRGLKLAVAGLLIAVGTTNAGQAIAELVGPTPVIPRDAFRTWSLFLVCNPDWVTPQKSADLAGLYWSFKRFGNAIGKDHLAVWFWTKTARTDDPRLTENVNVAASADYCAALKLRPSAGPFLVITTAYPELKAFPRDRAVFELGGLGSTELTKLLNALNDDLIVEGKVDAARAAAVTRPPPDSSTGFWIRLLEATRRSMIGFGCTVNVKVETGPLSAELRECASP